MNIHGDFLSTKNNKIHLYLLCEWHYMNSLFFKLYRKGLKLLIADKQTCKGPPPSFRFKNAKAPPLASTLIGFTQTSRLPCCKIFKIVISNSCKGTSNKIILDNHFKQSKLNLTIVLNSICILKERYVKLPNEQK